MAPSSPLPTRLLPALAIAGLLGALALLLDHGRALGVPLGALDLAGRAYAALLVLAPLLLYPIAFFHGERFGRRVLVSLLPSFLWWLTEVGVRLERHSLPEALWLAASPINLAHGSLLVLALLLADIGCRIAARALGRPERGYSRRIALRQLAAFLLLGLPVLPLASVWPFLHGYRALFQADVLPPPAALPGPLAPDSTASRLMVRPPNIVFVLSDDHRWDVLGHEGHPFARTPSLDRLAGEGVRFTRSFVTSALCSPSRASFLTGTTPHRHGVWNNFTPWSDDNQTFLEHLKQAGYATAFIGKWHMPGGLPKLRGVDHFVTFTALGGQGVYEDCPLVVDGREEPSRKRYIAEELTDRALEWLEVNRGSPFALYLSHKSVHSPFTPDEPEQGLHAQAPIELPPGAHPWVHLTKAQYMHLDTLPLGPAIRRYTEAVASMDRQIGRLLDRLDELGLTDSTLVVYSSDNGYLWGEHGLVDKRWAYEESIRVPLLVRYPGLGHPAGGVVERQVLNLDLMPTLLAAAGLPAPAHVQGRSWLPLLLDPDADWRDDWHYTYTFEPPYPAPTTDAIRTERFKYVEYEGLPPALFDLEADPGEQTNLAEVAEHRERREELARRLADARAGWSRTTR